ncbi:hypothetical protein B296_00005693 [Ensete ventricosum]|uniref:Uncharacterized protein n=1 Tax=Ensete ventricosum TaxID=4639 RepID=A0A427AST4_ENSVE|nr:hypothetical protein B296_00005693 [Ensete ventricosum]
MAKPLATRAACKGNHPWPSPLQGRPSRKGQPPTARAATNKRNRPWPWLPPIGSTPTEASPASMMPARSLGGAARNTVTYAGTTTTIAKARAVRVRFDKHFNLGIKAPSTTILVAWPAMLATAVAKGIKRVCSDTAGCRGGDSSWVVLVIEEEDGSRAPNNEERTTIAGSCGYDRGLEMAALGKGRSGVGAVAAKWGLWQQRQGRWGWQGRSNNTAMCS